MLALAFLALLPRVILGFLLVHAIWPDSKPANVPLRVFLAASLGLGVSSLLSFLWIWAGLDLRTYVVAETGAVSLVAALTLWRRRSQIRQVILSLYKGVARRPSTGTLLLGVSVLLFAGRFWISSIQMPHAGTDAWANWNVVARFVYRGGQDWTRTFLRIGAHPDYPLLLPMTNATTWELLPRESTRGPMAVGFLFTACLLGLSFGTVLALRDAQQAALAAIAMMTPPLVINQGIAQMADVPFAGYFLSAVGLTLVYLRAGEARIAVLAGLSTGLAAWTKNEGLAIAGTAFILWAWIDRSGGRAPLRNFVAGLAGPLLLVVLFKVFLAPRSEFLTDPVGIAGALADLPRYPAVVSLVAADFWKTGWGSAAVLCALALYVVLVGQTTQPVRGLRHLAFMIAAQALIYLLIYVVAPYDLAWRVTTTSERLYLQLIPSVVLGIFLRSKSPSELWQQNG